MSFRHSHLFDPTGGFTPDELLKLDGPGQDPSDFDEFWESTYAMAMGKPLDWRWETGLRRIAGERRVRRFSYAGLLGNRLGGWLSLPLDGEVERGMVALHGYGGRSSPEFEVPGDRMAVMMPCLSGLPKLSSSRGLPKYSDTHVIHGIVSRETYLHRFCTADVWRAASVLLEAMPETSQRLDLWGESFGGGIGALALPWDKRFYSAHLCVPSFGHHPVRLTLPCSGSGESVRKYVSTHPEAANVLEYFDAARAAKRIRIPVHIAAATFDPAVPPAGQFAVFNRLQHEKKLFVLSAGHFIHRKSPAEQRRLFNEVRRFFA